MISRIPELYSYRKKETITSQFFKEACSISVCESVDKYVYIVGSHLNSSDKSVITYGNISLSCLDVYTPSLI